MNMMDEIWSSILSTRKENLDASTRLNDSLTRWGGFFRFNRRSHGWCVRGSGWNFIRGLWDIPSGRRPCSLPVSKAFLNGCIKVGLRHLAAKMRILGPEHLNKEGSGASILRTQMTRFNLSRKLIVT
jgi:hypothetical protein